VNAYWLLLFKGSIQLLHTTVYAEPSGHKTIGTGKGLLSLKD